MQKSWYRLWHCIQSHSTVLLLNLAVILPFGLITGYIKLSTLINGYSTAGTLNREAGLKLLTILFSEPYAIPYEGILTEISEIIWCFPIALCLFAASLLKYSRLRRYLISLSVFLTLLLIDDAFRITLILYFVLSIPKILPYGMYVAIGVAISAYFRRTILQTPYGWLFLATSLMAISVAASFLPIRGIGTPIMLEDGTKLLGLVNLTIYVWKLAQTTLSPHILSPNLSTTTK